MASTWQFLYTGHVEMGMFQKLEARHKIFTNGQDFHCFPPGILLMQKIQKITRGKREKTFNNSICIKNTILFDVANKM